MEYIVLPGFINPVSNVKITLLDSEKQLAWDVDVGGYLPDKFITTVRNEIYDLPWALNVQQVTPTLDKEKVE